MHGNSNIAQRLIDSLLDLVREDMDQVQAPFIRQAVGGEEVGEQVTQALLVLDGRAALLHQARQIVYPTGERRQDLIPPQAGTAILTG